MSGLPPTDRTPIVSIYFSITMVGLHLSGFTPQNSTMSTIMTYFWKHWVPLDTDVMFLWLLSNVQFVTTAATVMGVVILRIHHQVFLITWCCNEDQEQWQCDGRVGLSRRYIPRLCWRDHEHTLVFKQSDKQIFSRVVEAVCKIYSNQDHEHTLVFKQSDNQIFNRVVEADQCRQIFDGPPKHLPGLPDPGCANENTQKLFEYTMKTTPKIGNIGS